MALGRVRVILNIVLTVADKALRKTARHRMQQSKSADAEKKDGEAEKEGADHEIARLADHARDASDAENDHTGTK
jgi:hypothetical protein